MLFGFHAYDKTIDEHLRAIATLASDSQTLVFLDTNILAYLYKLHEAARSEFFVWSDSVVAANRLVIPAWAASEYLSRVTSKSLDSYTPKSKEPSQAKRVLDALHETASLFVDEPLLHKISFSGDRAAYLNGFRGAIDALEKYTRAFSQQFDPSVIHQQVIDHLSAVILDSDLAALCTRASKEGGARFEHRLPPGFRDGNKDENRFGDLIIWFEILDKAVASKVALPKVLFITNDEKSDWVYAPKMRTEIVAGARKAVGNSNPEIKLADPRLVSEFKRQTGHPNLSICSLATLVEGLSKVSATQFAQLAAAIQINTQEAAPSPSPIVGAEPLGVDFMGDVAAAASNEPTEDAVEVADEMQREHSSPQPIEPVEPRLQYELEALQDSHYQSDAPSEINVIIRDLKSLNWYTQNPAIVKIQAIRDEDFTPSSWFVLGRNIYQAACGNSQKAMDFMAALKFRLGQFPNETAMHLLAGMLFEIYFDAHGELRDVTKFGYADKPLAVVTEPAYADACTFILFHLHRSRARLNFLPGSHERKTLRIVSEPVVNEDKNDTKVPISKIQSVTLDGTELIRETPNQLDDAWELILGESKISHERLKATVSEDLAIPKWAITIQFDPLVPDNSMLVVPKGLELHAKQALK